MLQVPLGVLEKCEQMAEDMIDMIDIRRHVHKYVPQTESAVIVERIFFGGDQVNGRAGTRSSTSKVAVTKLDQKISRSDS